MNTNTLLLVAVLVLLVGGGVWWYSNYNADMPEDGGLEVNIGATE